jgi:transcriptional regulator with GAF, ATPase, and Fis domain/CHASE2 domain-containing sensor protein
LAGKKLLYIKLFIVILVAISLLLIKGLRNETDKFIENVSSLVVGERTPDTNIVIIHISKSDLDRIGPWPIKRSYYALLIKSLTEQKVKKIGLEVFLSSRLVIQSIYDKLLKNEIEKSGKVVLGSLAGRITEMDHIYLTDSLSYPSPKLLNESFLTGHLDYLPDDGIVIPLVINNHGVLEKAFSYQLLDNDNKTSSILINFRSSWKSFKRYSLLEYFKLVQDNSRELNGLENKIVLIGISDPQIAVTIKTAFDNHLPGVALHAFALDNLLKSRWLKTDGYFLSAVVFILIISGFILIQSKKKSNPIYVYLIMLLLFLFIEAIFFVTLNYRLANSFFMYPFITALFTDGIFLILEKRNLLKGIISESEALKRLLYSKQQELFKLQKVMDVKEESNSTELIEKINALKSDIEKLKEDEEDKRIAELPGKEEVKNFHGIVYRSKVIDSVVEIIKKASPENATLLIAGESGTGKELVAQAIHSLSTRKDNNYVAVNCSALTESLLESELFGHVKGAFTGAYADKKGKFEAAHKGTIFLDEIGETSENFQAKLLRVLQTGEIEKVGSAKRSVVDVRVIAATNKNLEEEVKNKKFREDLYYRLNVIQIKLPPLRERKEDIEILTPYFLNKESSEIKLSKAVSKALLDYEWKGNVRELESVIKRGVIFAKSEGRDILHLSDLPKEIVKSSKYQFEELVLESLRNKKFSHSSVSDTAKELGNVNRTMVAENFRGIVFKTLYENNFDINKSAKIISETDDTEANEKVLAKIETFISNIKNDIDKTGTNNFDTIKGSFASKYKNLPVKFHVYLDEIIKWQIKKNSQ